MERTVSAGIAGLPELFTLLILYGAVHAGAGRVLHRWARRLKPNQIQFEIWVAFVVLALLSGAVGEWIGVHATVGAFAAGIVTPHVFRDPLIGKLEGITLALPLPLFFTLNVGMGLVGYDASRGLAWIWGYVIGLKCMLLGGVLLTRGFVEWRESLPPETE